MTLRQYVRTARAWARTLTVADQMILLAGRKWPVGGDMTECDAVMMARIIGRRYGRHLFGEDTRSDRASALRERYGAR